MDDDVTSSVVLSEVVTENDSDEDMSCVKVIEFEKERSSEGVLDGESLGDAETVAESVLDSDCVFVGVAVT